MPEIKTLAQAEKQISESETSFIAVGEALGVIRDACLFSKGSAKAESFEAYCADRWDWSRVQAYRLIGASTIAKIAKQIGFILNERQARELKGLENDPEILEDILGKAKAESESGRITAKGIHAVRDQLRNPDAAPENVTPLSELSQAASDPELDDPDNGEDWNAVLTAAKRSANKMTKELPPQLMGQWASTLAACEKKARRRALAGK